MHSLPWPHGRGILLSSGSAEEHPPRPLASYTCPIALPRALKGIWRHKFSLPLAPGGVKTSQLFTMENPMRKEFQPDDRELLLDLFGKAHTIKLRLDDLGDELELDSDAQQSIQHTAFKAHDLLTALSSHLID